MSKKRLFLSLAGVATAVTLCAAGCGGNNGGNTADEVAPVITVTGVPETCNVGDVVTVPAATANDNVDGDVSAKIKVTVSLLKADNASVSRDIIYEKAGNVAQTFTAASNELLNYRIIYTCKDAAGNEAKLQYALTATPDNETGTLELKNFTASDKITGVAGTALTLPAAVAIDQPGDVDISHLVEARLYEKKGDTVSTAVFARYTDFKEAKSVRIPAGEYNLVYSVKDAAGNEFETKITVPVTVAKPAAGNLALDSGNFELDHKEGMSWVNEFGEVSFGHTSERGDLDQTVGVTENLTKVYDQYVGVSFRADPPTTNGQLFFTLAARGSKNRNSLPDKETCTWPTYLFLRVGTGRIESRVERTCDKEMTTVKGFNNNLLDGKNHTIYLQWKNVGESAKAANAAIMLYGWVDKTPAAGYDDASFIFKAVSGPSNAQGVLAEEAFEEMWSEASAGWFTMDTYSPNRPHDDDYIRVKGLAIYDKDETQFALDITAPDVTVSFDGSKIYATQEDIEIPEYTVAEEGCDKSCFVIKPDGTRENVTGDTYTPTEEGTYQLVFSAVDGSNNTSYVSFKFSAFARDEVAPTITLSSEAALSGKVGDEIALPTATASDDRDGDITSRIKVEVIGTEHATGLSAGQKFFPTTAGAQKVVYSVADSFGNVTKKEISLNVASLNKKGNLLPDGGIAIAGANGKGLRGEGDEWIYDQKVSMIANIDRMGQAIQFNIRGVIGSNPQWPKGIVVKFNSAGIHLSAFGHDGDEYGSAYYDLWKYIVGVDFLFEYETKNVVIDGEEYIRVRLWIQGEELQFSADGSRGGQIGLEDNVKGIYRKVSEFLSRANEVENIYSSPFWVGTHDEASITIKELRTDGTSCQKPEGPQKPAGFEAPKFDTTGNAFITEALETAGKTNQDGDGTFALGKNSNEDYIAVTFHGSAGSKGAFVLNVLGDVSGWDIGLAFRLTQDGFELRAGGNVNGDTTIATYGVNPYSGGINNTEYTLVYKLTYIVNGDYATGIKFDAWLGEKGGTLAKLVPTVASSSKCSYDAATDALVINVSETFASAAQIAPKNISLVALGALNGSCEWTVSKIEKLLTAPDISVVAPDKAGETAVKVNSEIAWTKADHEQKTAVENIGGEIVAVTFHRNGGFALGINVLGETTSSWHGNLVIALRNEGNNLRIGGINEEGGVAYITMPAIADDASYTIAYRVKYLKSGETVSAIRLEIWAGAADGTLTKVTLNNSGTPKISFDTANQAFIIAPDAIANGKINPDCSFIAPEALITDGATCTIKKVEILEQEP